MYQGPGFRFHPTDEEIVCFYLKRKLTGNLPLCFDHISVIDIYKFEPWDLPSLSKLKTRDLEWYFFTGLDKKYGSSNRTSRATDRGYWKTTGKDRVIKNGEVTVGMKKTLVYHLGRAPHGNRSNWVMHEYRIIDQSLAKDGLQDAYVLCRVFEKSGSGPKNGEKYGAPFVEAEWENVNVVEGHVLSLLSVNNNEVLKQQLITTDDDDCIQMFDTDQDFDASVTFGSVVEGPVLPFPSVNNNEVLKQQLITTDDDDYIQMFDTDQDFDASVTFGSVVEGHVLPFPSVNNNEVLKQQPITTDDDYYIQMFDIDQDFDASVTFGSVVEGQVLPLPPVNNNEVLKQVSAPARVHDPDVNEEWVNSLLAVVDNEDPDLFDMSPYLTDLGEEYLETNDIKNPDEAMVNEYNFEAQSSNEVSENEASNWVDANYFMKQSNKFLAHIPYPPARKCLLLGWMMEQSLPVQLI